MGVWKSHSYFPVVAIALTSYIESKPYSDHRYALLVSVSAFVLTSSQCHSLRQVHDVTGCANFWLELTGLHFLIAGELGSNKVAWTTYFFIWNICICHDRNGRYRRH